MATTIDKRNPEVLCTLGKLLTEQGSLNEAVKTYRQALRLLPEQARAPFGLGNALAKQGNFDEASAAYRLALKVEPGHVEARQALATLLLEQGKLTESVELFRGLLDQAPTDPKVLTSLGKALALQGKRDEALTVLRQALKLRPGDAATQVLLGQVQWRKGDFQTALTTEQHALELIPLGDPLSEQAIGGVQKARLLLECAPRLPAVLSGQVKPASVLETAQWVTLCRCQGQDIEAARLFQRGCQESAAPSLDVRSQDRFEAISAALHVGCGLDQKAKGLAETERARWRKQALEWLRLDLKGWTDLLADSGPRNRTIAMQRLNVWKCHVDLAAVREPAALAKLPPSERESWQAFWAEVDAALRTKPKPVPRESEPDWILQATILDLAKKSEAETRPAKKVPPLWKDVQNPFGLAAPLGWVPEKKP